MWRGGESYKRHGERSGEKDTEERKTNPSGGFPTPLSPLPPSPSSSLQSSRHTQPGAEWAFTVQLCFPSERSVNVKFSTHKKKGKKKKNTFPFLLLLFLLLLLHSLSPFLSFPHVSALNLIPLSFILLLSLSLNTGQCPQHAFTGNKKKDSSRSLVDPLQRHAVFSQWRLNYIFMVTQIRFSCLDTQTHHGAKAPSTHLLGVCLHSRNCPS